MLMNDVKFITELFNGVWFVLSCNPTFEHNTMRHQFEIVMTESIKKWMNDNFIDTQRDSVAWPYMNTHTRIMQ